MNNPRFTINIHNVELFDLEDLVKNNDSDLSGEYSPYNLSKLQTYNPIYLKLFSEDGKLSGGGLNNRYQFKNLNQVIDTVTGKSLNKITILNRFS